MHRLLFSDAGAAAGYYLVAGMVVVVCCRFLRMAVNHCIDDLIAPCLLQDATAIADWQKFVIGVIRAHFQESKFRARVVLTYIIIE